MFTEFRNHTCPSCSPFCMLKFICDLIRFRTGFRDMIFLLANFRKIPVAFRLGNAFTMTRVLSTNGTKSPVSEQCYIQSDLRMLRDTMLVALDTR